MSSPVTDISTEFSPKRRRLLCTLGVGFVAGSCSVIGSLALKPNEYYYARRSNATLAQLIPTILGGWTGKDLAEAANLTPDLDAAVKAAYDDTLTRLYTSDSGAAVTLVLAYVKIVDDERRPHSPEVCYPAQGAHLGPSERLDLHLGNAIIPAKTFAATLPSGAKEFVAYWINEGGIISGTNWEAKKARLDMAVRRTVPDGLLVRLSIPSTDQVRRSEIDLFANALLKSLPQAGKSLLFGQFS